MAKTIYTNRCNCDDSIALEKQLFECKLLIKELNQGRDPDLPIKYLSDGSAIMYPVEVAKYKKAMAHYIEISAVLKELVDEIYKTDFDPQLFVVLDDGLKKYEKLLPLNYKKLN